MAQNVTIDIKFRLLEDINKKVDSLSRNFDQLNKKRFNVLQSSFTKIALGVTALNQGLQLASRAFDIAKGAISPFIREASKIEDLTTQFKVLTGSVQNASILIKDLQEFSAKTPFRLEGLATASRTLLSFGFAQNEIIDRLTLLGDAAAATGNDIGEIALIFGQVQAAGKLTGERFLQLAERGINVGPAIAKTMGVAESAVADLRSQGKITFDIFDQAFKTLTAEGGQFANGMIEQSKTLSGVFSTLQDNISLLVADIGKFLLPVMKEAALSFIEFIQTNKELIKTKAVEYLRKLGSAVAFVTKGLGGFVVLWDGLVLGLKSISNVALRVAKSFVGFADIMANLANSIPGVSFDTKGLRSAYIDLSNAVEASNKDVRDQFKEMNNTSVAVEKASNKIQQFTDKLGDIPVIKKVNVEVAPTVTKQSQKKIENNFGEVFKSSFEKSKLFESIKAEGVATVGIRLLAGGAGGAKQLTNTILDSAATGLGTAFGSPQAGQAIAETIKFLSLPQEQFKEIIDNFFDTLIGLPDRIAENAPALITKIVERIPDLITAFTEAMPKIQTALLILLTDPEFWRKVAEAYIRVTLGRLEFFANAFAGTVTSFKAIVTNFEKIPATINTSLEEFNKSIDDFVDKLKSAFDPFIAAITSVSDVFNSIVDKLKSIPGIGGGGGIIGGVTGAVGGVIGSVAGSFGFADGGMVPRTPQNANDGFLARLSGGERILSDRANARLESFLDSQESGAFSGPITINLQVGEAELASTILNLNQKGFRIA